MSKRRITEASLILAGGTLVVTVLQMLKLMIVSSWFGASSGVLDPYFAGLNVLLTFQGVLFGSLQASFIPLYVASASTNDSDRARNLISSTIGFGLAFYGGIAILAFLFPHQVLRIALHLESPMQRAEFSAVFRALIPAFLLSGMADLLSAVYVANKRYFLSAFSPVAMIVLSIAYLYAFPDQKVYALVFGQAVGAGAQFLILWIGAPRFGDFRVRISLGFCEKYYTKIYVLMLPVAGGLLLSQANILIDQAVASRLGKGSVSILGYASRLHDVVIKLFIFSVGNALLPFLAQYVARKQFAELRSTMALGVRLALLSMVPAGILVWLFGAESVAVLFQRNQFRSEDSAIVGEVWAAYSAGLFFTAYVIFGSRLLMALQDVHPLWILTVILVPMNYILDVVLSRWFGVQGIALGTCCMYVIGFLFFGWRIRQWYHRTKAASPNLSRAWRTVVCLAALVAVGNCAKSGLASYLQVDSTSSFSIRVLVLVLIGLTCSVLIGGYAMSLRLMRVTEANFLWNTIGRLFRFANSTPNSTKPATVSPSANLRDPSA